MRMKGYSRWLDPPEDPPESDEEWCFKHRMYDCFRCEQNIEIMEEAKRDRWHEDNPEDDYIP